jgi:hypothetical protein
MNAIANLQNQLSKSKPETPATNMDDLVNKILASTMNWVSKATGIKMSSLLETGVFANAKLEDAAFKAGDAINKGATSFTSNGGALANVAGIVFNKENLLNGITQAQIDGLPIEAQQQVASIRDMMGEGMPVTGMSNGDLGGLTPMNFGNMAMTQEIGRLA